MTSLRAGSFAGSGIKARNSSLLAGYVRSHYQRSFHSSVIDIRTKTLTPIRISTTSSPHIRTVASLTRAFSSSARRFQDRTSDMADPTGLIAKSGIELLTFGTPNGVKASILLEELKEAYGKEYTVQSIHIGKNIQKQPWYTDLNPNGRIPTIVDHDRGGFAVFEGLPILTYLTRHYDPEHKFSFPVDSDDYSVAEQWIAWQHGGLGPMQGQAGHFLRAAPEKIPWAIQRYVGEAERLYGILNTRLADRDYIVGPGRGQYSIADISIVGWTNYTLNVGIDLPGQFPHVDAWLKRLLARPAVQRGFVVPSGEPSKATNPFLERALAGEAGLEEQKKGVEETRKIVADAKEKYGYKYSSP